MRWESADGSACRDHRAEHAAITPARATASEFRAKPAAISLRYISAARGSIAMILASSFLAAGLAA